MMSKLRIRVDKECQPEFLQWISMAYSCLKNANATFNTTKSKNGTKALDGITKHYGVSSIRKIIEDLIKWMRKVRTDFFIYREVR
jgi:hypothetical protein